MTEHKYIRVWHCNYIDSEIWSVIEAWSVEVERRGLVVVHHICQPVNWAEAYASFISMAVFSTHEIWKLKTESAFITDAISKSNSTCSYNNCNTKYVKISSTDILDIRKFDFLGDISSLPPASGDSLGGSRRDHRCWAIGVRLPNNLRNTEKRWAAIFELQEL